MTIIARFRASLLAALAARKQNAIAAMKAHDQTDKYAKGFIAGIEASENIVRTHNPKI